jgi:glutaredoxin 3
MAGAKFALGKRQKDLIGNEVVFDEVASMSRVIMYTTAICPYCNNAKKLLQQKGVTWEEIRVDSQPGLREEMIEKSGQRTVPQIWINDFHVGGFTDLWALDKAGKLDPLLKAQ